AGKTLNLQRTSALGQRPHRAYTISHIDARRNANRGDLVTTDEGRATRWDDRAQPERFVAMHIKATWLLAVPPSPP
ncbi:MAG TPA: hypothetical protein VF294_05570, partial [Polyangiaceae bacterium]